MSALEPDPQQPVSDSDPSEDEDNQPPPPIQWDDSSLPVASAVKSEPAASPQPSTSQYVPEIFADKPRSAELDIVEFKKLGSSDSSSEFTDEEDYLDSDVEEAVAYPTTITSVVDIAGDSNDEGGEGMIPTTVDVDEANTLDYTETSAAAFNSFWKYKKLPKGPKVRQKYEIDLPPVNDPHKPIVFSDPVFDKSQRNTVIHYGKARVGEGNDITPKPMKLLQLGKDIQRINEQMAALTNSSTDKREKMKLSSRVCRMKRSANHEANKIKFAGLEQEREELCRVIREFKRARTSGQSTSSEDASTSNLTAQIYHTKVAGRTSEYVNSVLESVRALGPEEQSDSDFD